MYNRYGNTQRQTVSGGSRGHRCVNPEVHKEGDKYDVNNYRPISVLPVLYKIIERAVHKQLYSFLTDNNILNSCQSDFRRNHSTSTSLIEGSHVLD